MNALRTTLPGFAQKEQDGNGFARRRRRGRRECLASAASATARRLHTLRLHKLHKDSKHTYDEDFRNS